METLIIQNQSKAEMKLLKTLAERMGLKAKFLRAEEIEEIALANAMENGRTGKYVDTQHFIEKLKKK